MTRRTNLKATCEFNRSSVTSTPYGEGPNPNWLHHAALVEGKGRKKDVLTERTLYSVFHDLPILS